MPEPIPFGDTSFRAIVFAICCADPLNVPHGGCVESVLTSLTHLRLGRLVAAMGQLSASPLEELHRTLVFLCSSARPERPEISSAPRPRIGSPRVEAVLSRLQLADHDNLSGGLQPTVTSLHDVPS
jgi:hypothetical protein